MWGEAGTPKPVFAYMLEAGLAQLWQHFKWSLDATAHVDRPAAHGAQLARRRGALRKAGHQQPRGPVCLESRASLLHEDFKSSGGWGGLQLHDAGGHGPVCCLRHRNLLDITGSSYRGAVPATCTCSIQSFIWRRQREKVTQGQRGRHIKTIRERSRLWDSQTEQTGDEL